MDKDVLMAILNRPIAYHRVLVPVAGSIEGAVWLGQLIYWADRGSDPDRWIWKTQIEWQHETMLGRKSQERVRKIMKNKGILEEERRSFGRGDCSCQLFYRLNFEKLINAIKEISE